MSNIDLQTEETMYKYAEMSQAMTLYLDPSLSHFALKDIVEMFCKSATNSIGLSDTFFEYTGYAVSLDSCIMNHACLPNASAYFIQDKLYVRVIRDCFEGEELTLSYLDGLNLKKDRQKSLMHDYAFQCGCDICTRRDDGLLDAFLCPELECDGLIQSMVTAPFVCEKCGPLSSKHSSSFKSETNAHKKIINLLNSDSGKIH